MAINSRSGQKVISFGQKLQWKKYKQKNLKRKLKKSKTWLVANIPRVFFFRFDLPSLYTVVFDRYPRPKKISFWPKKWNFGTFFKSDDCLKKSILIICHGGHFSFSKLFLKVAKYTWSAESGNHFLTPQICVFFGFNFFFLKLYLEKSFKIAVVGNVPGDILVFYFFPSLSWLAVLGRFLRQIWNFWSKTQKKYVFFQTNQFSILVNL